MEMTEVTSAFCIKFNNRYGLFLIKNCWLIATNTGCTKNVWSKTVYLCWFDVWNGRSIGVQV